MTNTENKFRHYGVWYIAVEQDGCRNCAFNCGGTGCASYDCSYGYAFPSCNSIERKDNRSVIFVESDADNFGDEE